MVNGQLMGNVANHVVVELKNEQEYVNAQLHLVVVSVPRKI